MTIDDDRVVVIGSGPTGAIAASRLVDRGVAVTMLDAGTHQPRGLVVKVAGHTAFRYSSQTELADDRTDASSDVEWFSSLSLGGLSNYWTAAVPRFAPDDFVEGGQIDERFVWPVTYEDLVPHYSAAERMLRITAGNEPIPGVPANEARHRTRPPRAWRRLIEAANDRGGSLGVLPLAKGPPWMIARRAREFATYQCVVAPMLGRGGFELRTGAHVVGLRWNGQRVDAVDYVQPATGTRSVVPCRAVVVAAGAIDSTVLLLRSVSGDFPDGLGNTSGVIGRYLHDHPREWWVGRPSRSLPALAHPVYMARDAYGTADPLLATSLTLGLATMKGRLFSFVGAPTDSFGVQVFGTMVPQPTVGVGLGPGFDVDATDVRPHIDLRFDTATMNNVIGARQRLRDLFGELGMALEIPGPFHEIQPGSAVHYGGTVRMHRSPAHGASDGWNRLHDVRNVAVVDSSAFTTGPEKNPTLTAMALADRAALHLADDLRDGELA